MLAAIARPYAKAAFEYAESENKLAEWVEFLQMLAPIMKERAIKKILSNPNIDKKKLADVFISVIKTFPVGGENFMRLLAAKHRLNLLPRIAELFMQYYSSEEKVLVVDVTTAAQMTEIQSKNMLAALQKHFGKTITMQTHKDESLLGGAFIRADDLVIDASVKGSLKKLAQALV